MVILGGSIRVNAKYRLARPRKQDLRIPKHSGIEPQIEGQYHNK